ncbi:MAG: DUF6446 family protein [Sulfitobacter sp.]
MKGKFVGGAILISAAIAGAALYYTQVYAYYQTVDAPAEGTTMISVNSGQPEAIATDNYQAIDAQSSPIRYRACFDTHFSLAMLSETYQLADKAVPRNAPGWFDCFDAAALGAALEKGEALAFVGQKNVAYGVDRIVAVTAEGRGYVWHELNECGAKSYDGTVIGEACPERPAD